jgi:hypothetical protein
MHPVKVNWGIYSNASLLELGVSDLRSIDVTKVTAKEDRSADGR